MDNEQFERTRTGHGFIAALDQSGGSTPKALALYGISPSEYSGDDEMFALMHKMRSRIMESPSFNGDRVLGAILFEGTMDREIEGKGTADYLWGIKHVVPFLKVDKGLQPEENGAQLMKPVPDLASVLEHAKSKNVFGTKMRSFIKLPDPVGVKAVVNQQFDMAHQIIAAGLVPIIEPEIDIHSPGKAEAESLLKTAIAGQLSGIESGQHVMLKLSLPEEDDFYSELLTHPRVLRVVALSGGYTRHEANERLAHNHGVIASFSRALTEGLAVGQSEKEFDAVLDGSIASIFEASET